MQPYLQLVATIYSTTHATLKKSVENYIWLHNKLQLVANDKKRGPLRANINITKASTKSTKNNHTP